jgi:transposase
MSGEKEPENELSQFLDLRVFDIEGVPEEARASISLRAYGLPTSAIASRLKLTENTVRGYIRKYKLEDAGEDGSKLRKKLLAGMFETIAMECLCRVSKQNIMDMKGLDKFSTAVTAVKIMKELRTKPITKAKSTKDIVKGLTKVDEPEEKENEE